MERSDWYELRFVRLMSVATCGTICVSCVLGFSSSFLHNELPGRQHWRMSARPDADVAKAAAYAKRIKLYLLSQADNPPTR